MDTIFENGVTYYKLRSEYSGDTTKNCGLIGSEIDNNFYTLRGHDIGSVAFSGNQLVLKRLNGGELFVNLSNELSIGDLGFIYDKDTGVLTVKYADGTVDSISGFTTDSTYKISTDNSLEGNGTINHPLKVSAIEETGAYSPADEYYDLTEGEEIPDESDIYPGYRMVTKEYVNNFGKLYSKRGMQIISEYLSDRDSEWRVPSKEDWDKLLDSLEHEHTEDSYKPHSSIIEDYLGEDAAQQLKSKYLWRFNENPVEEDGTCGFNVVGFDIIPTGRDADGDLVPEKVGELAGLWTSTESGRTIFVKEFSYDTNKVGQSLVHNGFYAIRLVKDYNGNNYRGNESIFGQSYPTTLIPETSQIWTSINVYATKKQIEELSKNVNFIDADFDTTELSGLQTTYYINEWNGNEWLRKELKEGDSIVIKSKDVDEGITKYYRRWLIKDNDLCSFEDWVNDKFVELTNEFNEQTGDIEDDFNGQINTFKDEFSATVETTRNEFNSQMERFTNEFNSRIESLTNNFNLIISNMNTTFNETIQTLSGELSTQINSIDSRLETFLNDELEGTIKYTIKQYIEDTTNEIKITETEDGKLKIGFSDDAIFG